MTTTFKNRLVLTSLLAAGFLVGKFVPINLEWNLSFGDAVLGIFCGTVLGLLTCEVERFFRK